MPNSPHWLASIWGRLRAIPGAFVVREHLAFAQDRLRATEQELAKAQNRNAELEEQVRALHEKLAPYAKAKQFEEERGAYFKRRPGGGYHDAVYCPHCLHSAYARGVSYFCVCKSCSWQSSFVSGEIPTIIAAIEERERAR